MLCGGNSSLRKVDIKRYIFQGDSLSPLVSVLALIPLILILRKTKAAYEFSGSKEKINHLLFIDDLKLHSRKEKGLSSIIQKIRVIKEDVEIEFSIEKWAILGLEKGKIYNQLLKLLSHYRKVKVISILEL